MLLIKYKETIKGENKMAKNAHSLITQRTATDIGAYFLPALFCAFFTHKYDNFIGRFLEEDST